MQIRNGSAHLAMPVDGSKTITPYRPLNRVLWLFMTVLLTTFYGSYTVLVHLCEVDGKIPFNSASLVLMIELSKFTISSCLHISEVGLSGLSLPSARFIVPFSVPAFLYCFNNNIAVHMQLHMDPASYQVLSNLKILSTAFLYRLIIKRPIKWIQWFALVLLALAGISNSYGGLKEKIKSETDVNSYIHVTGAGIIMMVTYCMVSGFAGVYTEYILKRQYRSSIHLQNLVMYSFGLLFNAGTYFYQQGTSSSNLFTGFSIYTWTVVLTQGLSGLMFSAIMKHSSNITRMFVISCAMVVTTLLSVVIFNLQLNFYFFLSFILVAAAQGLYYGI